MRREAKPEKKHEIISHLSFAELDPGNKTIKKRQRDKTIQKILGKTVAPLLSVTPVKTANEEIQPP